MGCTELTLSQVLDLAEQFSIDCLELRSLENRIDLPAYLAEQPGGLPAVRQSLFTPSLPPPLQAPGRSFEAIRQNDILLHHPYESFQPIISLLEQAAVDPQVLAIKMTLYRTSGDSPLLNALITAAHNEKQVTILAELKARFDEANNIAWARKMEEAGIHVVYGLVGLKTHCKVLLIVRREESHLQSYLHLGTGNYHPRTARFYTDFSLLTCRPALTIS